MFKKFLALTLACSLLGQNVLFAQQVPVEDLRQLQQQANRDVKELGLTDAQKTFLTIGGTVFLSSIVFTALHKHSIKMEQQKSTKMLEATIRQHSQEMAKAEREALAAHQAEVTRLQREFNANLAAKETELLSYKEELSAVREELMAAREDLRLTSIKKAGFEKSAAVQKAKRQTLISQLEKRELELQEIIAQQTKTAEFYNDLFHQFSAIEHSVTLDMEKYTRLFDETLPEAERRSLRAALNNEPFLKAATKEQQEMFLKYVDDAMSLIHVGKTTEGASHILRFGAEKFLPQAEKALYQRLISLAKHVSTKKNLFVISFLALLGVSAQSAQAQNTKQLQANRINQNFNIFLKADETTLAQIAQNPEATKVCVQGAYALHMMKALPQEDIQALANESYEEGSRQKQNNYQRVRFGVSY
ncbi:MAG: hypothetical protein IJ311_01640 [Elusimicrobiaceae bacterium]|nr:hypothetical protein [Elusimicrobiaceae bacterium]